MNVNYNYFGALTVVVADGREYQLCRVNKTLVLQCRRYSLTHATIFKFKIMFLSKITNIPYNHNYYSRV